MDMNRPVWKKGGSTCPDAPGMEYLPTCYMYPTNGPNVGKYSIHGAFGMGKTIRNRNKLEIYLGTTFQLDKSKQY